MVQSSATTVREYLASLPPDRRAAVAAVRDTILANLPKGFEEGMSYGMIGYYVPHKIYPAGYHCNPAQPLPFACLAAQKNYIAVYLMCLYSAPGHLAWFRKAWAASGRKLDMGKACVRFRTLEDVPLEVIGEAIRRVPVQTYIEHYEAVIRPSAKKKPARPRSKPAAKRATRPPAKRARKAVRKTGR